MSDGGSRHCGSGSVEPEDYIMHQVSTFIVISAWVQVIQIAGVN